VARFWHFINFVNIQQQQKNKIQKSINSADNTIYLSNKKKEKKVKIINNILIGYEKKKQK